MMDFSHIIFRRKFSMPMFKNLYIKMGEMAFTKDFINASDVTDVYPIIEKSSDCTEEIQNNLYFLRSGKIERWFCEFFPHATYEITAQSFGGKVGLSLAIRDAKAEILFDKNSLYFYSGEMQKTMPLPDYTDEKISMAVTCELSSFNIYFRINGELEYFTSFNAPDFTDSQNYELFKNGYAAVKAESDVVILKASTYLDNGVSQADMKPLRYENGDIIVESGKVYLTFSARQHTGGYQAIYSWVPGTAEIEMCGAIFFDCGDNRWCGDIASSILFNRKTNQWYIWYASFSHGHILGHGVADNDIRFGINVLDTTLMEKADENSDRREFLGFSSDEDPDFFYDDVQKKWYMAICRLDPSIDNRYRYIFFESKNPFDGYTYIGQSLEGSETGGSFVKIKDELLFVCGNSFEKVSNYRIYSKEGMEDAKFDLPDGGFRGWGTLMPVPQGSRIRYYWITFDRHNHSDYKWSYGNLYCYEAIL